MASEDTSTRALLEQLLAAQGTILQEVRESKEQIAALSSRLEQLEGYNRDAPISSADSAGLPVRQVPTPSPSAGSSTGSSGVPRRRSLSGAQPVRCSVPAPPGTGPQRCKSATPSADAEAPVHVCAVHRVERSAAASGSASGWEDAWFWVRPDDQAHEMVEKVPADPDSRLQPQQHVGDARKAENTTAQAGTAESEPPMALTTKEEEQNHVSAVQATARAPSGPSAIAEKQSWNLDDAVIIPKDKSAKAKAKRKINKSQTPAIIIPQDLHLEDRKISPVAKWRLPHEPAASDLLIKLPSQEDVGGSSSSGVPFVRPNGSRFSIREILHAGSQATGTTRKRKVDGAASVVSPPTKRPRLALETFEEVVLSLHRDVKYKKEASGESISSPLHRLSDNKDKILSKHSQSPAVQRKHDLSDAFEDDLSDLSDLTELSEDEDEKSNKVCEDSVAKKSLSLTTKILPVAGPVPAPPPHPSIKIKADRKDLKPQLGHGLLDADGIRLRLSGYIARPVDLIPDERNVLVTREFMSATYGGSPMEFYPKIGSDKRAALGEHNHHFLFPNLQHNPHAPRSPGEAGLLCRSGDDAPWGDRAMKLLVRIRNGMWWYMGEYKTIRTEPLSRPEFNRLPRTTKTTWAHTVGRRKKQHDVEIRARVTLRRQLGREPTAEDLRRALETGNKFPNVTEEEIIEAYENGHERIYIWCFKCVGYDDDFQRELAEKFAVFVPPPKKGKS